MRKITPFALAIGLLSSPAQAYTGYYYAGVSHTAPVAHYTTAIFQFDDLPSLATCTVYCHILAWAILTPGDPDTWDNYAEAGVGCEPGTKHPCTQQWLWWTNQRKLSAQFVAAVPLGLPIKVEMTKIDGQNYAMATWTWSGGKATKKIPLGNWYLGGGLHPIQLEVVPAVRKVMPDFPSPISFSASAINGYPEDTDAYLYKQSPLIPIGDLQNFSLTIP